MFGALGPPYFVAKLKFGQNVFLRGEERLFVTVSHKLALALFKSKL